MYTKYLPSFNELLRAYRRDAGLTQEELAARADLSARVIQGLEKGGKHKPRPSTIFQLTKALGLGPEDQARLAAAPHLGSTTGLVQERDTILSRRLPRSDAGVETLSAQQAAWYDTAPATFGKLLRQFRKAAKQTQAMLAESAGLSRRAVQDLERDVNLAPRSSTVQQLAAALQLRTGEAALLAAAARQRSKTHAVRHNLPVSRTPFVGRTNELALLNARLGRERVRLLTLVGPPGVGKTRLALAVAATLLSAFPDGVTFVPLVAINDTLHLLTAIAAALGINSVSSASIQQILIDYLRERHCLLVLDNFDQLISSHVLVMELLNNAPHLQLMITSRVSLGLDIEEQVAVPTLGLPIWETNSLAELAEAEAVALFMARARIARPYFNLTSDNASAVVAICRHLEGLPLAIELAAIRCAKLSPQALRASISSRLTTLTEGLPDMPLRHRTLRSAIAWSYSLLNADEQRLLNILSVFGGSWSLAAAYTVAGYEDHPASLALLLAALVDNSLLLREDGADGARFTMLETIREFAGEQLALSGEETTIQQRHLAYYVNFAEEAKPYLSASDQLLWLGKLTEEYGNIGVALTYALNHVQSEQGLRLAVAISFFWQLRSYAHEGFSWLTSLMSLGRQHDALWIDALQARGALAYCLDDREETRLALTESLALAEAQQYRLGIAEGLFWLGELAAREGSSEAPTLYENSTDIFRQIGDQRGLARVSYHRALLFQQHGELIAAREAYIAVLAQEHSFGDKWLIVRCLLNLGSILLDEGELDQAESYFAECLSVTDAAQDRAGQAYTLLSLGNTALYRGDWAGAQRYYDAALIIAQAIGSRSIAAFILSGRGDLARLQLDFRRAAACYYECHAIYKVLALERGLAWSTYKLGALAWQQGDRYSATEQARASMEIFARWNYLPGIAHALVLLAASEIKADSAAVLLGAADALLASLSQHVEPAERPLHSATRLEVEKQLASDWRTAYEAGQALTVDQAVKLALSTAGRSNEGTVVGA